MLTKLFYVNKNKNYMPDAKFVFCTFPFILQRHKSLLIFKTQISLSCFKMLLQQGATSVELHEGFEMKEEEVMLVKEEEDNMMIKEEEGLMVMKTEEKEIKWGTMIPLVGGSALGCSLAAGSLPQYHLTYSPFANNEAHLKSHWAAEQVCQLYA